MKNNINNNYNDVLMEKTQFNKRQERQPETNFSKQNGKNEKHTHSGKFREKHISLLKPTHTHSHMKIENAEQPLTVYKRNRQISSNNTIQHVLIVGNKNWFS